MSAMVPHSDLWFEEAFADPCREEGKDVPRDIKALAKSLCIQHNIRGICDPLYIANVTAVEMGRGDGCGVFYEEVQPSRSDRAESFDADVERLAKRLCHAYSSSIQYTYANDEVTRERNLKNFIAARLQHPGKPQDLFAGFDQLKTIAEQMKPYQDAFEQHWNTFLSQRWSKEGQEALDKAVSEFNAVLARQVEQVATLTGNNADTLKSAYAPKDNDPYALWFSNKPADFLEKVARFNSFNPDLWSKMTRINEEEANAQREKASSSLRVKP